MPIAHIRRHRTKVLSALAALSVALVAVSPASAQPNTSTPPKKGCSVQLQGPGAGQSIVYEHGYSFSVKDGSTGKTHTYKCNDGKWEETVTLTAGTTRGTVYQLDSAGTFQAPPSGARQFTGRVSLAAFSSTATASR